MSKNPRAYWTESQIFHSGDEYFAAMTQAIRKARISISIEAYIFEYDQLTQNLIDELKHAQQRGCHVQILVDGFGSYGSITAVQNICRKHHLQFEIFRPFPRGFSWFQKFGFFSIFRLAQFFRRLNRRDHRKVTLIDGEIAFLGSFNFTKVHSENLYGLKSWRDSGVMVKGESVHDLNRAFRMIWQRSGRGVFKRFFRRGLLDRHYHSRLSYIRLNTSLRDRFYIYRDTIRRIKQAQHRVRITTAYFLPQRGLLKALKKAAQKGVQVEIITPGISDAPIVKWAGLEIAHALMQSGAQLYEYQGRVLHAKILVVDNWASIGSTNINHRSFIHDLECEAIFQDQVTLTNLEQQWQLDLQNSKPLTTQKYGDLNWFLRLLSRLAFTFRYWL